MITPLIYTGQPHKLGRNDGGHEGLQDEEPHRHEPRVPRLREDASSPEGHPRPAGVLPAGHRVAH